MTTIMAFDTYFVQSESATSESSFEVLDSVDTNTAAYGYATSRIVSYHCPYL